MNVYFGKMKVREQLDMKVCIGKVGEREKYFGGIQPNDYAFIRFESDGANVSRLWKCNHFITDNTDTTTAYFDEVFTFNQISTDKLIQLIYFKITKESVIFTKRSIRGVGFFKLDLTNTNEFIKSIADASTFNTYIGDENHLRKIEKVNLGDTESDVNVQLVYENNTYRIYNQNKVFIGDLLNKFKPNRYIQFKQFLADNPSVVSNNRKNTSAKKMKRWLETDNGDIAIINLWDLFCSDNDFVNDSEVDSGTESQEENVESTSGYYNDKKLIDIIREYISKDYKQIILTGAPGTGKTYSVKNFVGNGSNVEFVQFHPSYDYSDFVEGLRPVVLDNDKNPTFVRMDGIFKKFCRKVVEQNLIKKYGTAVAWNNNSIENYNDFVNKYKELENDKELKLNNYYFLIDEINRADLSKVFGELMYCLEDSYRGLADSKGNLNLVNTQYNNLATYKVENSVASEIEFDCFAKGFFIPKNVYIIGTMNDIDRSVEAFDFALRRRFEWIDVKANEIFYESAKEMLAEVGLSNDQIDDLTDKVINMNDIISKEDNLFMLTESHHIGHAYFKKYDGTKSSLNEIFKSNIVPILKEYTRGRKAKDVEEHLIIPCGKALGVKIDD